MNVGLKGYIGAMAEPHIRLRLKLISLKFENFVNFPLLNRYFEISSYKIQLFNLITNGL